MKKLIVFIVLVMSLSFACFAEEPLDPCSTLVIELAKQYMAEDLGEEKAALFTHSTIAYHQGSENWSVIFFAPNDGRMPEAVSVMSIISYTVEPNGHVEFGEVLIGDWAGGATLTSKTLLNTKK